MNILLLPDYLCSASVGKCWFMQQQALYYRWFKTRWQIRLTVMIIVDNVKWYLCGITWCVIPIATYETGNICSSIIIKLDCMFGVNEKPLTVIFESRNTFFLLHLKRFSLWACSVKNLRLKKSNKHRRQILYNVYIHDDDAMERKTHLLMCTQFSIYYPLNRE